MDYFFDHVRLKPDKQIGAHSQPDYELSWIITGSGTRTLGSVSEHFEEGEVVLVPPGVEHHWDFSKDDVDSGGCIENVSFHFSRKFIERIAAAFPELSAHLSELLSLSEAVRYQSWKREDIISILMNMDRFSGISRIPPTISLVTAISDFSDTVRIGIPTRITPAEKRLEKVRVYISCNYMNRITIDEISSYVGMNRTAFCSFFKKQTSKTFISYLNAFRIELASKMLMSGSISVSETATAVGFESLPHFCRTFRQFKGAAPSSCISSAARNGF